MRRPSRQLTLTLLTALAVLVAVPVAPATAAPERAAEREAKLQRAVDRVVAAGVPGAVLLVRERGRTTRLTSGHGNLKPKTPMRAGDRFRVGSVTKTFVATVVLQLVGEGRLGLEDSVERWLPGVVPNGAGITVRQLLNHTSGLFAYGGDSDFVMEATRNPLRVWTPREIVAIATAHPPNFAPGEAWSYSDTNYFVLGLIVETATGRTLASELGRRIIAPLRLRATSLPSAPRIAGRHAHGYFLQPLQDVSVGSPSFDWAAGGLVSNARDLAGFFRALLGGRLVRPELLRLMRTTVAAPLLGRGYAYGLGLQKVPAPCGALWGHTGASPGYDTHALNGPRGTRQVVVLVNATSTLSPAGFFGLPTRAGRAVDRLITTAYCD